MHTQAGAYMQLRLIPGFASPVRCLQVCNLGLMEVTSILGVVGGVLGVVGGYQG